MKKSVHMHTHTGLFQELLEEDMGQLVVISMCSDQPLTHCSSSVIIITFSLMDHNLAFLFVLFVLFKLLLYVWKGSRFLDLYYCYQQVTNNY